MDKHYYISHDTITLNEDAKQAALALKTGGEISKAVSQTNGALIWQLIGEVEKVGAVDLESVYDEIAEMALADKRDAFWEQAQQEWLDSSDIKIYQQKIK